MKRVKKQKHLPDEVKKRMMELLMKLTHIYGGFTSIAKTLLSEFKCLQHIPVKTLTNRVRYHYSHNVHCHPPFNPLLPLIGRKNPSKTPVITVSRKYLMENDLWNNSICLSGLNRDRKVLHYDKGVQIGAHLPIGEDIDLYSVKRKCLLIIVPVNDWMDGGKFPSDYVAISLSENHGPDDFVLVMISGSHEIKHEQGQKLWDMMFIDRLKNV